MRASVARGSSKPSGCIVCCAWGVQASGPAGGADLLAAVRSSVPEIEEMESATQGEARLGGGGWRGSAADAVCIGRHLAHRDVQVKQHLPLRSCARPATTMLLPTYMRAVRSALHGLAAVRFTKPVLVVALCHGAPVQVRRQSRSWLTAWPRAWRQRAR